MNYFYKLWTGCFLGLFSCWAMAIDYPSSGVEMKLKRASEHVWFVSGVAGMASDNAGFISNAAFIVTDKEVIVFDALGTPSLGNELLQHIRSVTDKPVGKVIVSHYHADHIYGLQVFKDLGAEIIAADAANDYLDSPAAGERLEERRFSLEPWVNDKTRLVPPDVALKKSVTLNTGGITLSITHLGAAHSQGDLSVLVEPDNVLLTGDLIFEGRVPFVGDADTRRWLEILQRMEASELAALIPGHGPPASDPNATIALTRRYLAYMRDQLGTAVDELVPFDEAYGEIDWSEFASLPAFEAAHRRNAYQVFLSMEAESLDR